jgi:hypothetical protein
MAGEVVPPFFPAPASRSHHDRLERKRWVSDIFFRNIHQIPFLGGKESAEKEECKKDHIHKTLFPPLPSPSC